MTSVGYQTTHVLSSKCRRELEAQDGGKWIAEVRAKVDAACKGTTGIGAGNCRTANFAKFSTEMASTVCPNDPMAVVPSYLAYFGAGRSGLSQGVEVRPDMAIVSHVPSSSGEETWDMSAEEASAKGGISQKGVQTALLVGTGALLLLALLKPRLR